MSLLECSFSESDVVLDFSILISRNTSFVNEAGRFVFEGTFIFISAFTSLFCIFEVVANNLSIMSLDNAGHIFHAAVAYFHSIFVVDLVEFVIFREMFI